MLRSSTRLTYRFDRASSCVNWRHIRLEWLRSYQCNSALSGSTGQRAAGGEVHRHLLSITYLELYHRAFTGLQARINRVTQEQKLFMSHRLRKRQIIRCGRSTAPEGKIPSRSLTSPESILPEIIPVFSQLFSLIPNAWLRNVWNWWCLSFVCPFLTSLI